MAGHLETGMCGLREGGVPRGNKSDRGRPDSEDVKRDMVAPVRFSGSPEVPREIGVSVEGPRNWVRQDTVERRLKASTSSRARSVKSCVGITVSRPRRSRCRETGILHEGQQLMNDECMFAWG